MSFNLTKIGPINLPENAPAITPSKAYKGSNTLLKSTPLQDEYNGANWDYINQY